jgi:hypothetical protein
MPALTTIETYIYYRSYLTDNEVEWKKSQKHEKFENVLKFQHSRDDDEKEEEEALSSIKNFTVIHDKSCEIFHLKLK